MTTKQTDTFTASWQESLPTPTRTRTRGSLPTYRLYIMRAGYLLMALGLAGVVAALLATMSLLAFLALRYPLQLLPLLIFESVWKLIWLTFVAIPNLMAGDIGDEMQDVLLSVLLVVIILAVTPWDYVWKRYVLAPGEPWRYRAR